MKKLLIIIAVAVSGFVNGQDSIQDLGDGGRFQMLLDSARIAQNEKPSLKQGDNDIVIKPLFTQLFKDTSAFNVVLNHPSFSNFYVHRHHPVYEYILFTEWLVELREYGLSADIEIKQRIEDDVIIFVFYRDSKLIRDVSIYWDQSYDGVSYNNVRYICERKLD